MEQARTAPLSAKAQVEALFDSLALEYLRERERQVSFLSQRRIAIDFLGGAKGFRERIGRLDGDVDGPFLVIRFFGVEYNRDFGQPIESPSIRVFQESRQLGEKVRKEVVDKANAEASAVVSRAQEEIIRQKEKGIQEMKDTIASLSVQIAGRVIEKEVNEATHKQLVETLIKDLAKVRK